MIILFSVLFVVAVGYLVHRHNKKTGKYLKPDLTLEKHIPKNEAAIKGNVGLGNVRGFEGPKGDVPENITPPKPKPTTPPPLPVMKPSTTAEPLSNPKFYTSPHPTGFKNNIATNPTTGTQYDITNQVNAAVLLSALDDDTNKSSGSCSTHSVSHSTPSHTSHDSGSSYDSGGSSSGGGSWD